MANVTRFIKAQENTYQQALTEIKQGRKTSHWIWYVFPQIQGLGESNMSVYYAIEDKQEAMDYLENTILKKRLIEISTALLEVENKTVIEILGTIDAMKVKSSMTLFHLIDPSEKTYKEVLDKYYDSTLDENTIKILNQKQKRK